MAGQLQQERLANLRVLAQHHLSEIKDEVAEEQQQISQAEIDIQRYSKMSSFDRKKQSSSSQPSSAQRTPKIEMPTNSPMALSSSKSRFRPFQEILHRLRWDPKLNIHDYVVGYLERFEGIKEMPATSWIRDFSDEDWIPMHRVRYVKRVKVSNVPSSGDVDSRDHAKHQDDGPELGVVWDRDGRVDKFSVNADADARRGSLDGSEVLSTEGTSVTGGVAL